MGCDLLWAMRMFLWVDVGMSDPILFIYLFLLQIIIINKNKTSLETICENTCQTKF